MEKLNEYSAMDYTESDLARKLSMFAVLDSEGDVRATFADKKRAEIWIDTQTSKVGYEIKPCQVDITF